ncbi:tyrosine-type recombinase/integrase [Sanguibacter sp. HDW7]|uniref:tyrosine-type recombinase/integrase n=1 Tax=Sanguibacter sp. HDW7 TaxID=2714931 RepID=UPI00140A2625|nr:tyrosine-type recombinase/integrase [Sanguibacter sp. HDW7]QIK83174.1 tyrosine-type recombinase/integrase [Sanguibacter sp. HDW7]
MTAPTPRKRRAGRASFGSVRRLASGRWQARYPDEAGQPMNAPTTFETRGEAETHLADVRAQRARGAWIDPRGARIPLHEWIGQWIENGGSRGSLAPRTAKMYRDVARLRIDPSIGAVEVGKITPAAVRRWHTEALKAAGKAGKGEAQVRQAYALLKASLRTAEADGLIAKNPCQIVGAGTARSDERPLMSVEVFGEIVAHLPEHLRAPVVTMIGAHLRLGELVALRRGDLDLDAGTLRIERQIVADGAEPSPTKTRAWRSVDLPASVVSVLREHLASGPTALPGAPLFWGARPAAGGTYTWTGEPLRRAAVQRAWAKARDLAGHPEYHLHDARHTGLTVVAGIPGMATKDIMRRGGHTTMRAALGYQHAVQTSGKVAAAGLDAALAGVL